jgi:hypothetical protein
MLLPAPGESTTCYRFRLDSSPPMAHQTVRVFVDTRHQHSHCQVTNFH